MSADAPGLLRAAALARHWAAIARGQGHEAQAKWAEALARTYEHEADDEPTDPNVTVTVCPHCGLVRPAAWQPPPG